MWRSMTETTEARITSLEAARVGLVAAMEMHVRRSEELALEVLKVDAEMDLLRQDEVITA